MSRLLLLLDLQALFLGLKPGAVVPLVGNTMTTVQFQNPARRIVQEIAIVGDRHYGAGVFLQETLQPRDALGVQMVGGLIKQQHIRLG